MKPTFPLMLCAALLATGCAQISTSPLNPLNWFSAGQQVATPQAGQLRRPLVNRTASQEIDARVLVENVTAISVDPTPDGVIVSAIGTMATFGGFNAQLIPVSNDGGVLTLDFRVEAATAGARQITVARVLSRDDLTGVGTIRVRGSVTSQVSRR